VGDGLDSTYHTSARSKTSLSVSSASMLMPSALSLTFSTMAASKSAADLLALLMGLLMGLLMALLFAFASFCRR